MSERGRRYAQAVAAEVRAHAARKQMHGTDLVPVLAISQNSVSRRMTGKQPFTVDELADVADALGVEVADLLPLRTTGQYWQVALAA